ncbi:hypothetical protein GCK72_016677 [Caenorhabditis remanei]|uniref:G-protein coupled receptors family 1 profile domain-containing protein n=1 Tax=Caenorhabditis remanei TaxID=31234 RepID=A0A6A5G610_CAERE|nr:hypothetical protein GCK72_016677 [Caenorhabditis remanei]KAF1750131.1 hypothetical protein GCK72_016677 [Caenorhabditis remanei]
MISEIPPPLIPIALFYFVCATISLVGNMIMIVCFFRERSQELCFWLLLPSCIGLCISGPLLLSMGIDRFLACQSPMIYRKLCSRPAMYLLLQLSFPILYTVYLNGSSFIQRDSATSVICQVPLAMSGDSFEKFNEGGLFINVGVVITYFITFLKLKRVTGNASQLKVVFKSILYTVIFVILGWCTVTVVNILSIHLVANIDTQHIMMIYAGIGLNMACASNVFVFYKINSEYRTAIRRLFGVKVPTQIYPTTSMIGNPLSSLHHLPVLLEHLVDRHTVPIVTHLLDTALSLTLATDTSTVDYRNRREYEEKEYEEKSGKIHLSMVLGRMGADIYRKIFV